MSSTSGSVVSFTDEDGSIRLKAGDGMKERKLARQPLSFCQMTLALLKLKDIFTTNLSSSRGLEIDSYIANLCMISNKYSDLAYWNYHLYFWDKAGECAEWGVPLDWSDLDSEALHAAIAQSSTTNFCDLCQSWCHSPDSCPFQLHIADASQVSNAGKIASTQVSRNRAYYKGKEICNRYNFATCPSCKDCSFSNLCHFCNRFDHPVRRCPDMNEGK